MRQFITTITETITTVFGVRPNGIVVDDRVTRGLRARSDARSLLTRLTGQTPASAQAVPMCRLLMADAGAVGVPGHYCLSMFRSRPSWRGVKPGSGASVRPF